MQVIDLVLQTAREQIRRLDLERLPLQVVRPNEYPLCAVDVAVDVGNR